jgi:hypothetical protein
MTARKTRLAVVGALGLLMALASNSALGSIILDRPPAGEFSDPAGMVDASQGMAPAAPVVPPDKGGDPLTIHHIEALAPAGAAAGQPSSASQVGGSGSSNAAIISALYDLPQPTLRTLLPGEGGTIMPTGPPFELLRPPRLGHNGPC